MKLPHLSALILLLTSSMFANASRIGDVDIRIPQPADHEELCATSQDVFQMVARGTHPDSQLITCFINQEAWARREGGVMYKVEVMRPYIDRKLSDTEFAKFLNDSAKVIGYVNAGNKQRDGKPTTSEKAAIAELMRDAPSRADVSLKKGTWQAVDSGARFEIIQMVSSTKMETATGVTERDIATVMAFVNVKGKLLTLKVVNSRNEPAVSQSAVSLMRSWVGRMLQDNAI